MEADKMREFAGDIYKECGQLIALIDDIMKLSLPDEAAENEVAPESVDLYDLSQDILESLQPAAAKRSVSPASGGGRSRPSWGCGASSMRWCTISVTTPSSTTRTAAR